MMSSDEARPRRSRRLAEAAGRRGPWGRSWPGSIRSGSPTAPSGQLRTKR